MCDYWFCGVEKVEQVSCEDKTLGYTNTAMTLFFLF